MAEVIPALAINMINVSINLFSAVNVLWGFGGEAATYGDLIVQIVIILGYTAYRIIQFLPVIGEIISIPENLIDLKAAANGFGDAAGRGDGWDMAISLFFLLLAVISLFPLIGWASNRVKTAGKLALALNRAEEGSEFLHLAKSTGGNFLRKGPDRPVMSSWTSGTIIGNYGKRRGVELSKEGGKVLQAHHGLARYLAKLLGWSDDQIDKYLPCVILSSKQHQEVTNAIRKHLPYGTAHTKDEIREGLRKAYDEVGLAGFYDKYVHPYIDNPAALIDKGILPRP